MKFGVCVPLFASLGDARTLADIAVETEWAGWDGVFILDSPNVNYAGHAVLLLLM